MDRGWVKRCLSYLLLVLLAVSAALAGNLLFGLLAVEAHSPRYTQTASVQYGVSLLQGLLLYGLLSPLLEELLFRRLLYCWLRRWLPVAGAMVLSSILFGVYHGNLVQGVYGTGLGLLIVWCYEKTGKFLAPVLVHGAANVTVFTLTYFGLLAEITTPLNCVIFAAIFIFCLFSFNHREKNRAFSTEKLSK